MNDVWVSNPQCAINLAAALRMQLLNVANARALAAGAKQKSEILYEYVVASTQFRQRVEAIAEAFIGMQSALQEEKRAAQRQWAKREKQIEQVISNTAGMYGELQALTGLPDLPALTAGFLSGRQDPPFLQWQFGLDSSDGIPECGCSNPAAPGRQSCL